MARKSKDDDGFATRWEPTEQDVTDLRRELEPFEQKRIEGKLFSGFEQFMAKKGIIRIAEEGVVFVRDATQYNRYTDIKEVMDKENNAAHERIMAAFPNKAKEHRAKIATLGRPNFMPKRMPKVDEDNLSV